ncbi:DNA-binding protein [Proteus mirabilis]|uniref:DNA-binding protein n=1 Tax=Proteus mirabilis TaxID=584 RepID=A0ABD5LQX9_PROMI
MVRTEAYGIMATKKKHEFPLPVLNRPAKYRKSLIQKWLDDGGVNKKMNTD